MARKNQMLYLAGFASVILFVGFLVVPAALSSLGYGNVLNFKLLPTNSVVNTEITCYVKSTGFTEKQSADGTVVSQGAAKQSNFYIKNPETIFSIVDKEGLQDPITSFKIYPKVRCDIPNTNTKYPIELAATDLKLEVYSQNEKRTKVLTFTDVKRTNPTKLSDNKEITLAEFIVDPYKIEQALKSTGYDSYQEFRISGNLDLNYDGFEGTVYRVNIPNDKVKVTFYTTIGKAPDGVQTPDCPSNQVKKDGICVPKCDAGYVLVNLQCVPEEKPIECKANEEAINGKCVPKEGDGGQKDPNVVDYSNIGDLLAEWFNKITSGDYASLSDPKYLGINAVAALLILLVIVSIIQSSKPRS